MSNRELLIICVLRVFKYSYLAVPIDLCAVGNFRPSNLCFVPQIQGAKIEFLRFNQNEVFLNIAYICFH